MSNEKFRFQTFKGKALLEKLSSLSHLPHHERAKQCGYSRIMYTDNGRQKIQLNLSDFYDAILEARKQEGHQPKKFDAARLQQNSFTSCTFTNTESPAYT